MGWLWILIPLTALSIPIIAILSSVIEKYIKAQERQANLMTEEFIAEMTALRDDYAERSKVYEQRIANLEAIVAAQAGKSQPGHALTDSDNRYQMPDLREVELGNDEKVALLARKLLKER